MILMAINSNVLNALAQQALASGGLRSPLKGQDVLEVDPSQLDLNALPDSEFDALDPLTQPDTDLLQLASTGPLSKYILSPLAKGTGRLLSPGDNTFNNAQRKLEELQAEQGGNNNVLGRLDDGSSEPALDLPPTEVDDEGFGPGFDAAQEAGYQAYERGSIIRADGATAETVMGDLNRPPQVSPDGLLDDLELLVLPAMPRYRTRPVFCLASRPSVKHTLARLMTPSAARSR